MVGRGEERRRLSVSRMPLTTLSVAFAGALVLLEVAMAKAREISGNYLEIRDLVAPPYMLLSLPSA